MPSEADWQRIREERLLLDSQIDQVRAELDRAQTVRLENEWLHKMVG
jgi:hypothetical protein